MTGIPGARISGADSVAILADDTLLVGEIAPPGDVVDLHVLTLNGTTVVNDRKIPLGVAPPTSPLNSGGVMSATELPGGDFLVTLTGLTNAAPLFGNQLAIVSPSGQIRPLGTVRGAYANAAVLHPARQSVSVFADGQNNIGQLLEIDYPSGASQRVVAGLNGNTALDVDSAGLLVASRLNNSSQWEMVRLDPATGAVISICPRFGNGLAVERPTDRVAWATGGGSGGIAKVGYFDQTACRIELTRQLTGTASGVAVAQNPRVYGVPSGPVTFTWHTAPNPGGLPRVGNQTFGLEIDAPAGGATAPGALFVSLSSADLALSVGVRMLVDPTAGFALPVAVMPGTPIALAIPAAAPVGVPLHFQSFHLVAGQLAASAGLRVTPLR